MSYKEGHSELTSKGTEILIDMLIDASTDEASGLTRVEYGQERSLSMSEVCGSA